MFSYVPASGVHRVGSCSSHNDRVPVIARTEKEETERSSSHWEYKKGYQGKVWWGPRERRNLSMQQKQFRIKRALHRAVARQPKGFCFWFCCSFSFLGQHKTACARWNVRVPVLACWSDPAPIGHRESTAQACSIVRWRNKERHHTIIAGREVGGMPR